MTGNNNGKYKDVLKKNSGKSFIDRNPMNLENKNTFFTLIKDESPIVVYSDKINFNEQYHEAGNLLVNVVWKMYNDEMFDKQVLEDVFFKYINSGISYKETFVTFKERILNLLEKYGCSSESIEKAKSYFDELGINEEMKVVKSYNDSILGDIIYDDSSNTSYIVLISPAGVKNAPIYILEKSKNSSDEEIAMAQEKLHDILVESLSDVLSEEEIKMINVVYKQIPTPLFNFIKKKVNPDLDSVLNQLSDERINNIESVQDFFNTAMNYLINGFSYSGTAYDFQKTFKDTADKVAEIFEKYY